jgi:hypothetical protein
MVIRSLGNKTVSYGMVILHNLVVKSLFRAVDSLAANQENQQVPHGKFIPSFHPIMLIFHPIHISKHISLI